MLHKVQKASTDKCCLSSFCLCNKVYLCGKKFAFRSRRFLLLFVLSQTQELPEIHLDKLLKLSGIRDLLQTHHNLYFWEEIETS